MELAKFRGKNALDEWSWQKSTQKLLPMNGVDEISLQKYSR